MLSEEDRGRLAAVLAEALGAYEEQEEERIQQVWGTGGRRDTPFPAVPSATTLLSPLQIAASIREAERRQRDTVRAALQAGAEPLLGAGPAAPSSVTAPPR